MKVSHNTGRKYGNSILLATSILTALLLSEFALRIFLPSPITWIYPQESYEFDVEMGHILKPDQQSFTHDKLVQTNSYGIRDADYPAFAPPGTLRILALGDSQTFGNGLALKDTWPKQLETLMAKNNNYNRIEVINCGIPGTDTWQHEILLGRLIDLYHPDGVVLAFYVNDVVLKPRAIKYMKQLESNHFVTRLKYIAKQSALLLTVDQALISLKQRISPGDSFIYQEALMMGKDWPHIEKRWGQVERSLSAMVDLSESNDAFFIVVSLPRRDQVYGRISTEAFHSKLWSIFERNEIPAVDVLNTLKAYYSKYGNNLFIAWDGHNSALANRAIAEKIRDKSLELGVINNK